MLKRKNCYQKGVRIRKKLESKEKIEQKLQNLIRLKNLTKTRKS